MAQEWLFHRCWLLYRRRWWPDEDGQGPGLGVSQPGLPQQELWLAASVQQVSGVRLVGRTTRFSFTLVERDAEAATVPTQPRVHRAERVLCCSCPSLQTRSWRPPALAQALATAAATPAPVPATMRWAA